MKTVKLYGNIVSGSKDSDDNILSNLYDSYSSLDKEDLLNELSETLDEGDETILYEVTVKPIAKVRRPKQMLEVLPIIEKKTKKGKKK